MKYFIRAIKYMAYFTLFFCLLVGILWLISAEKSQGLPVTALFKDNSMCSIIILIVAVSAIYPYLNFVRRRIYIEGDFQQQRDTVLEVFANAGMVVESEDEHSISLRMVSRGKRFSHMWEDRITMEIKGGTLEFEGYRKDVDRIVRSIKYSLATSKE